MTRDEFLEKLRNRLDKDYRFVVVASNDEDEDKTYTIAVVKKNVGSIVMTFIYAESELVYNMTVGIISFYELRRIINIINAVLS